MGASTGLIIDIGGVLARVPGVVDRWTARLGLAGSRLLGAIYGGNDDTVLVGLLSEDEWWEVVRERLGVSRRVAAALRSDMGAGQVWDEPLLAAVRDAALKARTAILSNAWPSQRDRMIRLGLVGLVHEVVLSCEIGVAKPDPESFRIALERLGTDPHDTLFIDDTPGHVEVARSLGLVGHVHESTETTAAAIRQFVDRE